MKFVFTIFIASLLLFSCNKQSQLSKNYDCKNNENYSLEKVDDLKNLFSIDIPKNWKINLYQDEIQSSIYTADTTKQLTQTVLLDVTFINKPINFTEEFLLQQEQKSLSKGFIKVKSEKIIFFNKSSLYLEFKGKRGKFNYQTNHLFIKVNNQNFILAKTEVYGDSIVNQRLCNSFSLLESIKLNQ